MFFKVTILYLVLMLNDIKCLSQNLPRPRNAWAFTVEIVRDKIFWAKLTDQFYRGMVRRVDIEEALATM